MAEQTYFGWQTDKLPSQDRTEKDMSGDKNNFGTPGKDAKHRRVS